MATTLSDPEVSTPDAEAMPDTEKSSLPDATHLDNKLPEWFKLPRVAVAFLATLGVLYVFLSFRPLWHTDVWGHLAYGRYIVEHGGIPTTEPLLPLCEGVRFVDTAWLSQTMGYLAQKFWGNAGIQFLYAASISLCAALLCWRFFQRSGSYWLSVVGLLGFLLVDWQQILVARPQMPAMACFAFLLLVVTSTRWRNAYWWSVPLTMALWANLHGSFIAGLLLLGAATMGRGVDVLRRTRSLKRMLEETQFRRLLLLTQLAAAAVLINPYGIHLYAATWEISRNTNVSILKDWEPLTLRMSQGQAACLMAFALAILYRGTPRRIATGELLLLGGFGLAALWSSRMIVWWGIVASYFLVLHLGAILSRYRARRGIENKPSPATPVWAVSAIGLAWIFFAYTPFGTTVLHGRDKNSDVRGLSAITPVRAVEYLREHPTDGLIFNNFEWGDYLVWTGPPGTKAFVASHVHLLPSEVWEDYLNTVQVSTGWESNLDRYGINTILANPAQNSLFVERLRASDQWRVEFEDPAEGSVLFVRIKAI